MPYYSRVGIWFFNLCARMLIPKCLYLFHHISESFVTIKRIHVVLYRKRCPPVTCYAIWQTFVLLCPGWLTIGTLFCSLLQSAICKPTERLSDGEDHFTYWLCRTRIYGFVMVVWPQQNTTPSKEICATPSRWYIGFELTPAVLTWAESTYLSFVLNMQRGETVESSRLLFWKKWTSPKWTEAIKQLLSLCHNSIQTVFLWFGWRIY